jgi:hypothetical protein
MSNHIAEMIIILTKWHLMWWERQIAEHVTSDPAAVQPKAGTNL